MKSKVIIFLLALSLLIPVVATKAATANNLNGKILLQVESKGEAWYVNPKDGKRYYMANGDQAFQIMKTLGVGMSNKDVDKMKKDSAYRKKFIGKILLQVESKGEVFYISSDGRYNYLKDGASAFQIMRKLGLGITNANLNKVAEYKEITKTPITSATPKNGRIASNSPDTVYTDEDVAIAWAAIGKLDSSICNNIKNHELKGRCISKISFEKGSKHPCLVLGSDYPELANSCKILDEQINQTPK